MNCHANHPQEMYSSSAYLPSPGSCGSFRSLSLFPFSPSFYSLPSSISHLTHNCLLWFSCQPSASCRISRHVPVTVHVVPNPFSFPWLSIRRGAGGWGGRRIHGQDSSCLPLSRRASLDWQLADTQGMEAGHGIGAGGSLNNQVWELEFWESPEYILASPISAPGNWVDPSHGVLKGGN